MQYYSKGTQCFENQNYQQAIIFFTRSINSDRQNVDAYIYRALSHQALQSYDSAILDYSSAIEINPQDFLAYYNRAKVHQKLGDAQKARRDYSQAIQLDPQCAMAYVGRGSMNQQLKNYREALEDYTSALSLDHNLLAAYIGRGIVNESLNNYDRAIEDYSQAIRVDNKCLTAYFNRAVIYDSMNKHEESLNDYQKAIQIDPKDASLYYNRASIHHKNNNYREALKDISKVIQLDENNAQAYNNRGIILESMNDNKNALQDYTKAIKLEPSDANFRCNRGILYQKIRNYKGAEEDFQQALVLDPSNPAYLFHMADNQPESVKSRKHLQKGLQTFNSMSADKLKQIFHISDQKIDKTRQQIVLFNAILSRLDNAQQKAESLNKKRTSSDAADLRNMIKVRFASKMSQLQKRQNLQSSLRSTNLEVVSQHEEKNIQMIQRQLTEMDRKIASGVFQIGNSYNTDKNRTSSVEFKKFEPQQVKINDNTYAERSSIYYNEPSAKNDEKIEDEDNYSMDSSRWAKQNNQNNKIFKQQNKVQPIESKLFLGKNNSQSNIMMTKKLFNLGNNISVQKYRVKQEIQRVDKNVPSLEKVKEKIKQIPQFSLRQYYDCMLSFIYNHLIGYRIIYTVLNLKSQQNFMQAQNIFYSLSQNQPIVSKIPSFGVLVQTPFQINEAFLYTEPGTLIQQNSQRIGRSALKNYKTIIEYLSRAVEDMIRNKKFNDDLLQAIKQRSQPYLKNIWQKTSGSTSMGDDKKLKSILAKFSYTEQVTSAHMTLLTKAIQLSENSHFSQSCQSQAKFSNFIRQALPPNMKITKKTTFNQSDFHDMGATGIECFQDPDCLLM